MSRSEPTRPLRNYTGLTATDTVCNLIADGPSKQKVIDNPELVGDHPVALVNDAIRRWKHRSDYWFSLHPGLHFDKDNRDIIKIGVKDNIRFPPQSEFILVPERLFQGGSSSLFAVESLLAMGYETIHMWGVDLDIPSYRCFRPAWDKVVNYNIISHGALWND